MATPSNSITTSPSKANNTTDDLLNNIDTSISGTIFTNLEKVNTWLDNYSTTLSSTFNNDIFSTNSTFYKSALKPIKTTLDKICDINLAIVSAIYGQKYNNSYNFRSLNPDTIVHGLSPFGKENNFWKVIESENQNIKSFNDDIISTLNELLDVSGSNIQEFMADLTSYLPDPSITSNINNIQPDNSKSLDKITQLVEGISESIVALNKSFDKFNIKEITSSIDNVSTNFKDIYTVKLDNSQIKELNDNFEYLSQIIEDKTIDNINFSIDNKQLDSLKNNIDKSISSNIKTLSSDVRNIVNNINLKDQTKILNGLGDKLDSIKDTFSKSKNTLTLDIKADNKLVADLSKLIKQSIDSGSISKDSNVITFFLDSLTSISSFDRSKLRSIKKNLRKISKLFQNPNALTELGLSSKGLFTLVLRDIDRASKDTKISSDNAKGIGIMMSNIVNLIKMDESALEQSINTLSLLEKIFSWNKKEDDSTGLQRIVYTMHEISAYIDRYKIISKDSNLDRLVSLITNMVNAPTKIDVNKAKSKLNDIEEFTTLFKGKIESILDNLSTLQLDSINSTGVKLKLVNDNLFSNLSQVGSNINLVQLLKNIIKIGIATGNVTLISNIVKILSNINKDKIRSAQENVDLLNGDLFVKLNEVIVKSNDAFKALHGVSKSLTKIRLTKKLSISGLNAINDIVENLQTTLTKISKLKVGKDLDKKVENIHKIIKKVGNTALLAGFYGTALIPLIPGLLIFNFTFRYFVKGLINTINDLTKDAKGAKKSLGSISKLILISGGIMMAGALFMMNPGLVVNALLFSVTLGAFLFSTLATINLASLLAGKNAIANAEKIGLLIAMCGGIMILGSMFMYIPGIVEKTYDFTKTLAIFLLATVGIVQLITGIFGPKTIQNIKELSIAISILAGTMLIGAAFMFIPGMAENALKFAGLSAVFILATVGVISLLRLIVGEKSLKDIIDLRNTILVLAGTMLIGGALMYIPGMVENVLKFTGLTALFIVGTIGLLTLAAYFLKPESKMSLIILGGITLLLAATMLFAGYMIANNPQIESGIWTFIITSAIFVGGMALLMKWLGSIPITQLIFGALALVFIEANVWLLGKAMKPIVVGMEIMNGVSMAAMLKYLVTAGTVLGAAVVAIMGLGALMDTGVGAIVFASGVAAVAALAGCIWGIGEAISSIIKVQKEVEEVGGLRAYSFKTIFNGLRDIKDSMKDIADDDFLETAKLTAKISKYMSNAIADISEAVASYANLTVNIYDEKSGKLIGHRNLNETDFIMAGNNIQKIITTIGQALIDTFNNHKDWFEADSLIGKTFGLGTTPFDRIMKATTNMGKMISKIAEGIKDYATMRVPVYSGTTITSYRPLTGKDFDNAAKNIKLIIETLGKALLTTFEDHKDWFEADSLIGKALGTGTTPFDRIIKACTAMGDMISSIAKGVIDFSTGRIPIKYNSKGEPVEYKNFNDIDLQQLSANIGVIVTALGNAIGNVYKDNNNQWMWNGGESSPAYVIAKSVGEISGHIGNVAKVVFGIASKVYYDENNNKYDLKNFTADGEWKATLQSMIKAVPEAIMDVCAKNPQIFERTGWFFKDDSPFEVVLGVIEKAQSLTKDVVGAYKNVNDFVSKLPEGEIGKISEHIQTMIQQLPNAIVVAAFDNSKNYELKKIFNSDTKKKYKWLKETFQEINALIPEIVKPYETINNTLSNIDITDVNIKFAQLFPQPPLITAGSSVIDTLEKIAKKIDGLTNLSNSKNWFIDANEIINTITTIYTNIQKELQAINITDINNKFMQIYPEESKGIFDILGLRIKTQVDVDNAKNYISWLNEISTAISTITTIYSTIDSYKGLINKNTVEVLYNGIKGLYDIGSIEIIVSDSFITNTSKLHTGLFNLLSIYDKHIPTTEENNSVVDSIVKISKAASDVEDPSNFIRESEAANKFIQNVRQVDINKSNKMIELLNAMKENINVQSSNKVQQMMNQLVIVLSQLTEELNRTSTTMTNAKELQMKRQEMLDKTSNVIKQMLDKPIEVKVSEDVQEIKPEEPTSGSRLTPGTTAKSSSNFFSGNKMDQRIGELTSVLKNFKMNSSNSDIKT